MSRTEESAWLALAAIPGLGPKALWRIADLLVSRERNASWLLHNPQAAREALAGLKAGIVPSVPVLAESAGQDPALPPGMILLHPLHPAFPRRLLARRSRLSLPALLYAAGDLALLGRPAVAVVGRRDAGTEARSVTAQLAAGLAAGGIAVVSGHAPGIDQAAHAGALRAGGATIAALPEGLARFRPRPELRGLLRTGNALFLSQFPPDAGWASFQAMARNKLVAALADVLVVVVSGRERDDRGRRSGTFDAARAALTLGVSLIVAEPSFLSEPAGGNRDLFRLGGTPWDPRQGAAPIIEALSKPKTKQESGQKKLF